MLLEHHFRVGLHLKRINDGTCSSPNCMSLRSRNGDRSLATELYFQLSRSRERTRARTKRYSIRARFDAIAWRNGRKEEGWRGRREAETSSLSRFPPLSAQRDSQPRAIRAKNLVPSPRNDNRMDGCAFRPPLSLFLPAFPVPENFLEFREATFRFFFPSSFESSSRNDIHYRDRNLDLFLLFSNISIRSISVRIERIQGLYFGPCILRMERRDET